MDIESADIYEMSNEPDFIFTSIKIKDLEYIPIRVFYAICFDYNDHHYAACCHTHSNGDFTWFSAGRSCGLFDRLARNKGLTKDISDCSIDEIENEITFKIPKELIGDPKPGEILTYTTARSGLRFIYEPFTYVFGGELAIDVTPFGDNYIIQY